MPSHEHAASRLADECAAAVQQADADVAAATLGGGGSGGRNSSAGSGSAQNASGGAGSAGAPGSIEGSDFGWALGTLLRTYLKRVGEAISELPGGPRAYQVMSVAAAGSCQNQAAIAERMGLDRTLMTYLVDGLEAAGLVQRTPDPLDRRSRRVTLTDEGAAIHARLTTRVREVECSLLSGLPTAEAGELRRLLGEAASAVDADGPPATTESGGGAPAGIRSPSVQA